MVYAAYLPAPKIYPHVHVPLYIPSEILLPLRLQLFDKCQNLYSRTNAIQLIPTCLSTDSFDEVLANIQLILFQQWSFLFACHFFWVANFLHQSNLLLLWVLFYAFCGFWSFFLLFWEFFWFALSGLCFLLLLFVLFVNTGFGNLFIFPWSLRLGINMPVLIFI